MNHTLKQRSALVRAAERGLNREPSAILGDWLVVVAVAVITVLLGVFL